jgi:hypothetical protein
MIRQLAQCPYCKQCEIALDDHPELVFNPDSGCTPPCSHLAWVDGGYSLWELSSHGINTSIGSTEFHWQLGGPEADAVVEPLLPYIHELLEAGVNWPFAPKEPFVVLSMNAEEKKIDPKRGKEYTVWDVDGWAIFAEQPAAFWAALPACQERLLASMDVEDEDQA